MEIIPPLAVIIVVVSYLLVRGGTRLSDLDAFHDQIFEEKARMIGVTKIEFEKHLILLQKAVQMKNYKAILSLFPVYPPYHRMNMLDFLQIPDALLEEYKRLIDEGCDIIRDRQK